MPEYGRANSPLVRAFMRSREKFAGTQNYLLHLTRTRANMLAVMRMTLKEARKKRGLTPEELADLASVHQATVYRIEAGEIADPSNSTVARLELALRLRRGTLVFGEQAISQERVS